MLLVDLTGGSLGDWWLLQLIFVHFVVPVGVKILFETVFLFLEVEKANMDTEPKHKETKEQVKQENKDGI